MRIAANFSIYHLMCTTNISHITNSVQRTGVMLSYIYYYFFLHAVSSLLLARKKILILMEEFTYHA